MKFVVPLSDAELITLNELYKNHAIHRLRQRAHIILMSNNSMTIDVISKAVGLDRDTVSILIDNWENTGIIGLYDGSRSGRPSIFDKNEQSKIIKKIEDDPRSLKKVTAEITEETGKKASLDTVRRVLKKRRKIWKRMKKTVAKKPEAQEVEQAKLKIAELQSKEASLEIELYFFDESGFSLTPSVPYGWQDIGQYYELPSASSYRINVTGFLNPSQQKLYSWTFQGKINSDVVISVFDEFSKTLQKDTWVVLDNASFHCSDKVMEKIEHWQEKGLYLYYLPPSAPHLNCIEQLWNFMKYRWMPLKAYCSFDKLKSAVNSMLCGYGEKYQITFA